MKVHYCKTVHGNFGDDLNALIWPELLDGYSANPDLVMVGIGTLLDDGVYTANPQAGRFVCLGAGAGYGAPLTDMRDPKWVYRIVRGPLSAQRLGLDPTEACTDGAILLTAHSRFPKTAGHNGRVAFMPHHQALVWPGWEEVCQKADIDFISPREDPWRILEKLAACRMVIADAMHAAICADALRVHWTAVASSSDINAFKWRDWCQSMSMAYVPEDVTVRTGFETAMRRLKAVASGLNRKAGGVDASPHRPQGGGLANRVLEVGLRWEAGLGLSRGTLDSVAGALKRLAETEGQLSRDDVFERRKREMSAHLGNVKERLQSADAS